MALCIGIAAFLLALAIAPAAPAYADDDNIQLDSPVTVSDDITRIHVSKLDADTHEYVIGATMAIINEETKEVVDSWVTGESAHQNEKSLDVGVVYILRELAAPDGYEKVSDVRFMVNETEGEGISILSSGSDAELTESYKVALYDTPIPSEKETVITKTTSSSDTETTTSTNIKTTSTTKVVAPKTGDETPLTLVAALICVGISAILILQLIKRRQSQENR